MQFIGASLQTVLIVAGLAAAVITAFYLLKLRRRRVEVPFHGLWAEVLADQRSERDLWRRLRRLLSWLIQIALIALLGFALLDPRPPGEAIEGRHVLLLIDRSASMGATDVTGETTRFEAARRRARDVLETIGADDRVMLATFDRQVSPKTTFVSDPSLVSEPLSQLAVTDTGTDYQALADFIGDTLRGRSEPHAIVFSDGAGAPTDGDPLASLPDGISLHHFDVGADGGNAAITAFNARRYPSNKLDYELYAEVRSTFEQPVEVDLQLIADGREVDTKRLELPPGGEVRRFFPSQAVSGTRLEAHLEVVTADAIDGSPRDNRAFAVLPEVESPQILLVTDGNLYLEGALLLNPNTDIETVAPDDWRPELADGADIVIFDGTSPPAPESVDALYLAPTGDTSPWTIRGETEAPVIDSIDRNHPLMRWVHFRDLNIGVASRIIPGPADRAVVSGPAGPLLVARERDNRQLAALAFDPAASDLPLRVAFPMLMFNVVDWMALGDARYEAPRETGETWSVRLDDPTASEASVSPPDGDDYTTPLTDRIAYVRGLDTGFYSLATPNVQHDLAANLGDVREVDITPHKLGPDVSDDDDTSVLFERRKYWQWALILAGLLMALEWWSYHRRWTV